MAPVDAALHLHADRDERRIVSTTSDLPPLPEKRPISGQAGLNCVIWGKGHDDETLEAYAREAVRLDRAGRVGANLLCAYGCASEAQDPANRKPCPWWCGDTSKCAASPLTELKRIHGEMVRCGYMDQDYCGKPWAGEHNEKMRKWQARFDELLAMLLASAPSTPPDEATSRDASRWRCLLDNPHVPASEGCPAHYLAVARVAMDGTHYIGAVADENAELDAAIARTQGDAA